MSDLPELLERHRPILRYDSQEVYFADSAAEWTDNPQNVLRTAAGVVAAAATPEAGQAQLSLAFLCNPNYPDGSTPAEQDRIGDSAKDYVRQARNLHADARYANQMYGRWAKGSDGRFWLQYWFFYFYNDYNLVGDLLPAGVHEGDWEMIQLRLDSSQEGPDLAVYAEHKHAAARNWIEVEVNGDRPVIYVARGSHASYFNQGTPWTGNWFDHADGKGFSPEIELHNVHGDPGCAWLEWPGYWGDTQPSGDPLDSFSPTSPSRHDQWDDPHSLLTTAKNYQQLELPPAPALPPPPGKVELSREDGTLRVAYETSPSAGWQPRQLVVTVNSPEDPMPPTKRSVQIAEARGSVDTGIPVRDDWSYDAQVSAVDGDAIVSPTSSGSLPAA